jgi:quercetin dioxygenase-like cupin family protein
METMMPTAGEPDESHSEAVATAEISNQGYQVATKDYGPGKSDPHAHEYDICLHILSGELRLGIVDEAVVYSFGRGERCLVPAGTVHFEEHGALRMVVGRREPTVACVSDAAEEAGRD